MSAQDLQTSLYCSSNLVTLTPKHFLPLMASPPPPPPATNKKRCKIDVDEQSIPSFLPSNQSLLFSEGGIERPNNIVSNSPNITYSAKTMMPRLRRRSIFNESQCVRDLPKNFADHLPFTPSLNVPTRNE